MQAAYVPRRLISENISLVQEMVHSMKRKKGSGGSLALKMDMSKAFDRLEWSFLMDVLKNFSSFQGDQKGDPLSPFLFIIAMEALSRKLAFCEQAKLLTGVKIARRPPKINHLLFADDCLFLCKANLTQTRYLLQVIAEFSKCSGQVINFSKSSVYFSKNMTPSSCQILSGTLQVPIMDEKEKYLGLPFFIGRNKKIPFSVLVEKIENRMVKWNAINLSESGRTVMVKHVLNALPFHHMTSFKLPDQTIKALNSVQGKFWRKKDTNKGAVISWSNLSKDKEEGCLGLRDFECFNKALLAKSAWRLCSNKDDLWSRDMGAKYYPAGDIFNYTVKDDSSFAWRSISYEIPFIKQNSKWLLGNGATINIWEDDWIPDYDPPPQPKVNAINPTSYTLVKDLFSTGPHGLNVELLFDLFIPEVALSISSIPIHIQQKDSLIWKLEPNGQFTVRSAYKQIYKDKHGIPQSSQESKAAFPTLWILPIIPRERCSKVFEYKLLSPQQLILRINNLYLEQSTQIVKKSSRLISTAARFNLKWLPPRNGILTLNFDGSFDVDSKKGGTGLILRNFAGESRGAKCSHVADALSPEQVEGKALWEAMQWAQKLKLEAVNFETDSKIVVEAIHKGHFNLNRQFHQFIRDFIYCFHNNSN
ncbi:hypothetical protein C5167_039900 [Papaver somniferum]|uniref:Reverse transcriptase domain-containing protein n=1 Tax=Papaver somniferum TaxID=3469 RepID=A0A4Y7IDF0_PAPSO|nr:hypothetical protein C5167_039900 [Papaver somniferum]